MTFHFGNLWQDHGYKQNDHTYARAWGIKWFAV